MTPGTENCVGMIVSHRLPKPCVLFWASLTTAYWTSPAFQSPTLGNLKRQGLVRQRRRLQRDLLSGLLRGPLEHRGQRMRRDLRRPRAAARLAALLLHGRYPLRGIREIGRDGRQRRAKLVPQLGLGQQNVDAAGVLGVEEIAVPGALFTLGRQGQVRDRALPLGRRVDVGRLEIGILGPQGGDALGGQHDGVLDLLAQRER